MEFNIIYILFVMGAQIIKKQVHQKQQRILIQKYYHTKLFIKHKKSNLQFEQQLQSIYKRAACLSYQWATELSNFLKQNQTNKLYTEYKSVLKENCLKEGKKEKIFCSSMIEKSFYDGLKAKSQKYSQHITIQQLNQLFQQTKAYFMVKQWLHRLASTNNPLDQHENNKTVESTIEIQQQEKIFDTLVNLSIKMYSNSHPEQEQRATKTYKKQELYSSIQLFKLFKNLNSNMKFLQKESIIDKIQKNLYKRSPNAHQDVQRLIYFFGREIVFGYLFTIKQIGRINVSFLWEHFCQGFQRK